MAQAFGYLTRMWVDLLGLFDLLDRSASDTSPSERMVSYVGLVEFNEREY